MLVHMLERTNNWYSIWRTVTTRVCGVCVPSSRRNIIVDYARRDTEMRPPIINVVFVIDCVERMTATARRTMSKQHAQNVEWFFPRKIVTKIIFVVVSCLLLKKCINFSCLGPRNGKSRCDFTKFCGKCETAYYYNKNNRGHVCGEKYCHRCQIPKDQDHKCTMTPCGKNEKKLTRKRVYFDIEVSIL